MGNLDVIENREQIQAYEERELLPEGIYLAQVISSDVVNTSKGNGLMLKVEHVIMAPTDYQGRILYTNFNIVNVNAEAQGIGRMMLARLSKAVGFATGIPKHSSHLHDKVHAIKVSIVTSNKINPKTGQAYAPKNEIKGYYTKDKYEKPATKPAEEPNFVNNELPDFLK